MRSGVRLIVPAVPDQCLLEQSGLIARSRDECAAFMNSVHAQMLALAASTRGLPGGYPNLRVQRRSDRGSTSLRWFSSAGRMLSEKHFRALAADLSPKVRTWLLEMQVRARWLNSQERVCRVLADEYSELASLLAMSSSHAVSIINSDSGGLHHG